MGSSRGSWLVDDGSGVIDCIQRHPHQAAMTNNSPKKTVVRFSGKASVVTAIHSGSPIKQSRVPLSGLHTEVPCPPKPVTSIGSAVGVIGRVVVRGEGRVVLLDEISQSSIRYFLRFPRLPRVKLHACLQMTNQDTGKQ